MCDTDSDCSIIKLRIFPGLISISDVKNGIRFTKLLVDSEKLDLFLKIE